MPDILCDIFKNKKVNLSKLEPFGFMFQDSQYIYKKSLLESGFELTVSITEQGEISSAIMDTYVNDLYTLHLVDGAVGSFVGEIKSQYEETLKEIAERC